MKILLPPIRYQALVELGTGAAHWFAGFDPFGPSRITAPTR